MDRFRIRHRPFSLTAWNASSCPQIGPSASHAPRSLELVENRTFPDAAPVRLLTRADIARVEIERRRSELAALCNRCSLCNALHRVQIVEQASVLDVSTQVLARRAF